MRILDLTFVALVAFGTSWTLAAVALDLMAYLDSRSVLWLAFSRGFLGLACVAFAAAFAWAAWRARRALFELRWRIAAASLVVALPVAAVSFGQLAMAWIGVALAVGTSFAFPPARTGGAS